MKDLMENQIQKTIRSRRAVAPIIATLLLIAIAVIGGVMIYVFTQGFFGNSAISTSPSADTITMSGYDMREIVPAAGPPAVGIVTHEGIVLTTFGDAAGTPGEKTTDEEGAIYIRNVGTKAYSISKLEVNGVVLDFVAAGLNAGEYGIITPPTTDICGAGCNDTLQAANTILPGQEGTLVVSFDNTAGNDNSAAAGRTIAIKITSAGGSVFNFNVVIGSRV